MSGCFIDVLIKFELPECFVLNLRAKSELMGNRNGKGAVLLDNLSNVNCEPVIGFYLLFYKAAFLEVAIKNLPHMFFRNFVSCLSSFHSKNYIK